jgi:hypothetical protein
METISFYAGKLPVEVEKARATDDDTIMGYHTSDCVDSHLTKEGRTDSNLHSALVSTYMNSTTILLRTLFHIRHTVLLAIVENLRIHI